MLLLQRPSTRCGQVGIGWHVNLGESLHRPWQKKSSVMTPMRACVSYTQVEVLGNQVICTLAAPSNTDTVQTSATNKSWQLAGLTNVHRSEARQIIMLPKQLNNIEETLTTVSLGGN